MDELPTITFMGMALFHGTGHDEGQDLGAGLKVLLVRQSRSEGIRSNIVAT